MDDTAQDSGKYEKKNQQRRQNLSTHWWGYFLVCFVLFIPRKKNAVSCDKLILPE